LQNNFEDYIQSISSKFSHTETSELGYRTDFEILLKRIFEQIKGVRVAQDPKAEEGNKPDFIVLKHDVPILYVEVKDIGESLDKIEKSNQLARYYGYTNLVLTDYVEFRFYRNGLRYEEPIKIADCDLKNRTTTPTPKNYEHLAKTLLDFPQSQKESIRSGKHLAKIMGGKAQRIRDNIRQFYSLESDKNTDLIKLYETIKKRLVHDLTIDTYADMYAQTLVYGLFVARYYDKSLSGFSREEARELIPNSNPLLRHFFDHIVGADFDTRLKYVVDELCEVFSHANVEQLLKEYFKVDLWGKTHRGPDPVIHFYEDFLNEYDPALRKKMGAYYTPLPVVEFIVHSVDYLLKKEFGLTAGLADTSKTKDGLHKVQILDPACGTGTFISTVIRNIYIWLKDHGQKGRWPAYVHHDLLPRLYGFELMMAPYTIAHLKLGISFRKTGFWDFHRRLGIYLTNSLEESSVHQQDLFTFGLAESIAEESKEASAIKNEKPIMVVMGNPPYSVSSSNKGDWIQTLIKEYKKNLGERKINLDDDYIKFIRFAEHFIERNKSGIVAMITNNSFIDGITHRQMRKHLLETFDNIYVLNLHGSLTQQDESQDGSKDENVFDIQQGVAISIFVRKAVDKVSLGTIHYAEIFGKREEKFRILNEVDIESTKWKGLHYSEPYYFFVPKNFQVSDDYERGFNIDDLFKLHGPGVKTERDKISIHFDKESVKRTVDNFRVLTVSELRTKYELPKDSRDWSIERAKNDVVKNYDFDKYLVSINYRPFDMRWTYYSGTSKGFIGTPGLKVMRNILKPNIGLVTARQFGSKKHFICFITNRLIEISSQPYAPYTLFPLYAYYGDGEKTSNLNIEIVKKIEEYAGSTTPEDIFDYVYAALHSMSYREKYKEFLKIDYPRVPYPKNAEDFKKLAALGSELRSIHLLESPKVNEFITSYPIDGSNIVEKTVYKDSKVFINKDQYFGKVPESTWIFYVGGYQPAQKWLKDRKERELTNEDIEHYQKMIVALTETARIQREIDQII